MPSKQVIRLADRLKEEFDINADPYTFRRTYAGKWLKASGAYTWTMLGTNGISTIGGFEPISKYVIKKNKLQVAIENFHNYTVDVITPNEFGYDNIKVGDIIDNTR